MEPTFVQSKATNATVYLSGAQIEREVELELIRGQHVIVVGELSDKLQVQSLQIASNDAVTILSMEHRINYLKQGSITKEIEKLQEMLQELYDQRLYEQSQLELCDMEESFFLSNRSLGGTMGLKVSDFKEGVAFYNESMSKNKAKRMASNKIIQELNNKIQLLEQQLGGYSNIQTQPVSEVVVNVVCQNDATTTLHLSYFIQDASWTPSYDIRTIDVHHAIELHYKAKIVQHSNEDWNDVTICLSTGSPSIQGVCPKLQPWYLDVLNVDQKIDRKMDHQELNAKELSLKPCVDFEDVKAYNESSLLVKQTKAQTSVNYTLPQTYTIASGAQGQNVEIAVHALQATYQYVSIPKVNQEVFLLATMKDWEELNLLAGETNIFFKNQYLGQTYMDPFQAKKEQSIALGSDSFVSVVRIKGKNYQETTMIGKNIKQIRQWELVAHNLKSEAISIKIMDQIPVSVTKELSVELQEHSGALWDKDTGELTWEFVLEPAQSNTLKIRCAITHSKSSNVWLSE